MTEFKQRRSMRAGAVFALILCSPLLLAAPTGTDLLRACEQAMRGDFKSKAGMMCEWYVHACECTGKRDDLTPVCLPPGIDTAVLATQIIETLKDKPKLQSLDATAASHAALAPLYPCD